MNSATIIFPHQLFENHPALAKDRPVYLVEEWLFFQQYSFHKQKLVLHRASMKGYEKFLLSKKYTVNYVETTAETADIRKLISWLAENKITKIHYVDTVDDWLEKRIAGACSRTGICSEMYNTPNFLNTIADVSNFFQKKSTYFLTDFYIWQRKERKKRSCIMI